MPRIGLLTAIGEESNLTHTINGHPISTEVTIAHIVASTEGEEVAKNTAEAATSSIDGTHQRLASIIKMKRHVTIMTNHVLKLILIMPYVVIKQKM